MIQRIQSLYLLLVFVISGILPYYVPLWLNMANEQIYALDNNIIFGGFVAAALLAILALFSFKNRKQQFVLGRVNIILNFFLLGFFVYQSLNISGETQVSEKGIGMLFPIFSIVFLVLANKAIKKDERLVKSADRLR